MTNPDGRTLDECALRFNSDGVDNSGIVDAQDWVCPKPLLYAKRTLQTTPFVSLLVRTQSKDDLIAFAHARGFDCQSVAVGDGWQVHLAWPHQNLHNKDL